MVPPPTPPFFDRPSQSPSFCGAASSSSATASIPPSAATKLFVEFLATSFLVFVSVFIPCNFAKNFLDVNGDLIMPIIVGKLLENARIFELFLGNFVRNDYVRSIINCTHCDRLQQRYQNCNLHSTNRRTDGFYNTQFIQGNSYYAKQQKNDSIHTTNE